jgi:hypothetical protein
VGQNDAPISLELHSVGCGVCGMWGVWEWMLVGSGHHIIQTPHVNIRVTPYPLLLTHCSSSTPLPHLVHVHSLVLVGCLY